MERTVTLEEKDWLLLFDGLGYILQDAPPAKVGDQGEKAEELIRRLEKRLGVTQEELTQKRPQK